MKSQEEVNKMMFNQMAEFNKHLNVFHVLKGTILVSVYFVCGSSLNWFILMNEFLRQDKGKFMFLIMPPFIYIYMFVGTVVNMDHTNTDFYWYINSLTHTLSLKKFVAWVHVYIPFVTMTSFICIRKNNFLSLLNKVIWN